jgi:hypothetical protein
MEVYVVFFEYLRVNLHIKDCSAFSKTPNALGFAQPVASMLDKA